MKVINLILFVFLIGCVQAQIELKSHKEVLKLMGTRFEITIMADSDEIAIQACDKAIEEINRIEDMISSWKETSETTMINNNAGIKPVKVSPELYDLIYRSLKLHELTNGAFDITFASILPIYSFDKMEHEIPDDSTLQSSREHIGSSFIELNVKDHSVYIKNRNTRIGFGGIGKGYAANKSKALVSKMEGVKGGVINAAGDLIVWGENGKENGWPIQISDPKNIKESIAWLTVKDMSVVTSGDYEKYFSCKGKRYAHIIDPKTGLPTTGVKSVTVVCANAEVGDALATALFVFGPVKGITLIDSLKDIEALIITDDDVIHTTKNLILNRY